MTQNKAGRVVALLAEAQQVLSQALRKIEFAAVRVIERLSIGNAKELRGRSQLLPQVSCAGQGIARFRRRVASPHQQDRAEGTANLEFLSLAFGVDRQQRQLAERLLEL